MAVIMQIPRPQQGRSGGRHRAVPNFPWQDTKTIGFCQEYIVMVVEAKVRILSTGSAVREATVVSHRTRSWFLAWLAFLPVTVARAGTLAEPDTFWQVRTGLLTISHGA